MTYKDIPYPTLNDIYVITQTYKEEYLWPYRYNLLSFPSTGLLTDLFSSPIVNSSTLAAVQASINSPSFAPTEGLSLPGMPIINANVTPISRWQHPERNAQPLRVFFIYPEFFIYRTRVTT